MLSAADLLNDLSTQSTSSSYSSSDEAPPAGDQLNASMSDESILAAETRVDIPAEEVSACPNPDPRSLAEIGSALLGIASAAFIISGCGMLVIAYLNPAADTGAAHTQFARMESLGTALLLARRIVSHYTEPAQPRR